jgi:hypothetical protein
MREVKEAEVACVGMIGAPGAKLAIPDDPALRGKLTVGTEEGFEGDIDDADEDDDADGSDAAGAVCIVIGCDVPGNTFKAAALSNSVRASVEAPSGVPAVAAVAAVAAVGEDEAFCCNCNIAGELSWAEERPASISFCCCSAGT